MTQQILLHTKLFNDCGRYNSTFSLAIIIINNVQITRPLAFNEPGQIESCLTFEYRAKTAKLLTS